MTGALFCPDRGEVHTSISEWAVFDCIRSMAVEAHLGGELWHVLALNFLTLFGSETRDGEWVANGRPPKALEADVRLFACEVGGAQAMLECLSLCKAKGVFVVVVPIWGQPYTECARALVRFDGTDGYRRGGAVAGGQGNIVWHVFEWFEASDASF